MRPIFRIICWIKGHREIDSFYDFSLSEKNGTPCTRKMSCCTRCGRLRVVKEYDPNPRTGTIKKELP
jgi:hypothetical protein